MKHALNFIREHWPMAVVCLIVGLLYAWTNAFAELAYGALRLGVLILVAFGAIHLVFKDTIRKFLDSGEFADEFHALPGRDRVWITVGIIALILLIASQSITRADDFPAMQARRWDTAQIRKEKVHFVQATAAQIARNQSRYRDVSAKTGVPWSVIACLHSMECGLSFRSHLHNGDPLTARTRQVPAGRPREGNPPFAWEVSAVDALRFDKLDRARWSHPIGSNYRPSGSDLQTIEAYNGTGYQRFHPDVPTPYLWSWTTLYTRGKYVADGRFDPFAVSNQCGVVPLLKLL